MAWGSKRIETRSWAAPRHLYGQEVAIHAAKHNPKLEWDDDDECVLATGYHLADLPLGVVVAVGRLVTCYRTEDLLAGTFPDAPHVIDTDMPCDEYDLGNYGPGRFGWVFADLRPLRTPVAAKGERYVFTLHPNVEAAVRRELAVTV